MLRVFLVALALIGLATAGFEERGVEPFPQNPIHQAQWGIGTENEVYQLSNGDIFNGVDPSTFFYFCHSYCTFNGNYEFQRFWAEDNVAFVDETSIFDWSADGGVDFWGVSVPGDLPFGESDCDEVIDYYRYYPTCGGSCLFSLTRLRECQPEWIYIEKVVVKYFRDHGIFKWKHYIDKAFSPTESAWNEWAVQAVDAKQGNEVSGNTFEYDKFDGLFRYYPSADGSSLTSKYSEDYYYEETYVSNYEPNYCTMQMSHKPIDKKLWCNANLIDDSDNVEYPTANYCYARGAWVREDDLYDFGCGFGDSDDCDSVRIYQFIADDDDDESRSAKKNVRGAPSKTERLRQATSSVKKLAAFEKRDDALPQVSFFSPDDLFYYQNYAAGLRFPYCATKA